MNPLLLLLACAQDIPEGAPSSPPTDVAQRPPPETWPEESLADVPAEPRSVAVHGEKLVLGYDDGRVVVDGVTYETGLDGLDLVDVSACCVVALGYEQIWRLGPGEAEWTYPSTDCLGCSSVAIADDGTVAYGSMLILPDGTRRQLYAPEHPGVLSFGDDGVLYGASHEAALVWPDPSAMPEVRPLPEAWPVRIEGPFLVRENGTEARVVDLRTGETTLQIDKVRGIEALRPDGRAVIGRHPESYDWLVEDADEVRWLPGDPDHALFMDDQPVLVSRYGAVTRYHDTFPVPDAPPPPGLLPTDDLGAVIVDGRRLVPDGRVKEALRVDDVVVFSGWDHDDHDAVFAVEIATGRERWRHLPEHVDLDVFHPVDGGVVYGGYDGGITFARADGQRESIAGGSANPVAARSNGVLATLGSYTLTIGGRGIDLDLDLAADGIWAHPDGFVVHHDGGFEQVYDPAGGPVTAQGLVHQRLVWLDDTLVAAGLDGHVTHLAVDGTITERERALSQPIHHLAVVSSGLVVGGATRLTEGGRERGVEGLTALAGGARLTWADEDAVHHDGRTVETWGADQLAVSTEGRLAIRTYSELQLVDGGEPEPLDVASDAVAWSGDRLLAATEEGIVDAERPRKVLVPATDVQRLSAVGDQVATGSYSGVVGLWTLGGEPRFRRVLPGLVHDVALAPDGQHVAVALQDGTVRLLAADGSLRWVARFTGGPPTVHRPR